MRRLVLLALALAASPAAAQVSVQPVVSLSAIGRADATALAGARFSHTPVPGIRRDANGRVIPVSAANTFEVVAMAGATFADKARFTAVGQAAYLFPRPSGAVALWGPVAVGAYQPDVVGAGLRIETSFRAAGLTAAPVWARHVRGPRAAVLLDVSLSFVRDLLVRGEPRTP